MRQYIERAFGLLTQRWGVFWRPLRIQFKYWSLVCTIAAKLHNFCIDERLPCVQERHEADQLPGDAWRVLENQELSPEVRRSIGNRRGDLTTRLQVRGALRPPHAQCNTKA